MNNARYKVYRLVRRKPVPVSIEDYGKRRGDREVWANKVRSHYYRGYRISTVMLNHDHNFLGEDKPILFETMIFGPDGNNEQFRCSTYKEALLLHRAARLKVKEDVRVQG